MQVILKDATKIKNGRQKSTPKFFMGAKTLKLNLWNYSNFTITLPIIWRCSGDFFKVLLKFKMAATDQFHFFEVAKTQKIKDVNYSNFTITFPTIGRCACDFFKVLREFKMAAMHKLHNFCGRKNAKFEVRNNVQPILLKFKMATTVRL